MHTLPYRRRLSSFGIVKSALIGRDQAISVVVALASVIYRSVVEEDLDELGVLLIGWIVVVAAVTNVVLWVAAVVLIMTLAQGLNNAVVVVGLAMVVVVVMEADTVAQVILQTAILGEADILSRVLTGEHRLPLPLLFHPQWAMAAMVLLLPLPLLLLVAQWATTMPAHLVTLVAVDIMGFVVSFFQRFFALDFLMITYK